MRIPLLLWLLLCLTSVQRTDGAEPGPATKSLSLRQAIELALMQNLDLRIEYLNKDIANYTLGAAYGAYSPMLSFHADHTDTSYPADFDPKKAAPDAPYDLKTDAAGPSLVGRLPYGLDYNFKADAGEKKGFTDFNGISDAAQNFPWGVRNTNVYFADVSMSLSQHLLRDFWMNPDRATLLVSAKNAQISQQNLLFQILSTVLAVELAYYDVILGRETVRVQETALTVREQFLQETQRRIQAGDLPPLEAENAEAQLQNTLTSIAAAKQTYFSQQNTLKTLLSDNFREWVDTDLVPSETLVAVLPEMDRSQSFQTALKTRPDLVAARLAVQKTDVMVQFRKNQLFPMLDLVGRYGSYAIHTNLARAIDQAADFHYPDYFYGIVMSYPLGNVAERNNYRASKATRELAQLQLRKAEEAILLQIAEWMNRVQWRYAQVGSTRKARTYSESALQAEQRKLQSGLTTSFVVLQLQDALTQARMAEVLALVEFNKAVAQLAFAEGTLMKRHGLELNSK